MIISSKTNDFHRITSSPRNNFSDNYQSSNYAEKSIDKTEATATNHMSINLKNNLSVSPSTIISPIIASSHQMSSTVIYKPVQSVIQSTNANANGSISTPISVPIESLSESVPRSSTTITTTTATEEKYLSDLSSNQYYVLRSTADNRLTNNQQPPVYRERSIEETEAAHDLLSLSQSLPPLPAPCKILIHFPLIPFKFYICTSLPFI